MATNTVVYVNGSQTPISVMDGSITAKSGDTITFTVNYSSDWGNLNVSDYVLSPTVPATGEIKNDLYAKYNALVGLAFTDAPIIEEVPVSAPSPLKKVKTVKEALLHAARAIEEHGWVQGFMGNTTKGFCTAGALLYVTGGDSNGKLFNQGMNALGKELVRRGERYGMNPIGYNDNAGRTRQEVLDLFRATAAAL